jgi:hypothetical protein
LQPEVSLPPAFNYFGGTRPGTVNNASLGGRVIDPSGAPVEGAQVRARQTETNLTSDAKTDAAGRFRFAYLTIGPYELTIQAHGFSDIVRPITLSVGAALEVPVSLSLTSSETSVTVNAEVPLIETARSQLAETVSQSEVRNLPLNGRNFLDLALLVPGVSPTNTASTQLFPETSAVPGQGISISSQRNFSMTMPPVSPPPSTDSMW